MDPESCCVWGLQTWGRCSDNPWKRKKHFCTWKSPPKQAIDQHTVFPGPALTPSHCHSLGEVGRAGPPLSKR